MGGFSMSDDKTSNLAQDFASLVAAAMRELGASVGPDRLSSLVRQPSKPFWDDGYRDEVLLVPPRLPKPSLGEAYSNALKLGTESFTSMIFSDAPDVPDVKINAEYRVWYGTNRQPLVSRGELSGYSSDRDTQLHFGQCRVFVPKSHKIGSTGSPFWKRLLTWTDDRLSLLGTDAFTPANFWKAIAAQLQPFPDAEKRAVVFLHGYNVSFNDAALRAAQIGFDLSIATPMAFFSWPSQGELGGYSADEATIEWSADAIEDFLVQFVAQSGASVVHLIAHSMGNRGLLAAINSIAQKAQSRTKIQFGQIILAAADVDADFFRNRYRAYATLASRTTLYVSTRDFAVGASQWLHKYPRVGLVPPLFVADGIDTINVTNVDLTMLGHGYIAEARTVLNDMHRLLDDGAAPGKRMLNPRTNENGDPYWEFGA